MLFQNIHNFYKFLYIIRKALPLCKWITTLDGIIDGIIFMQDVERTRCVVCIEKVAIKNDIQNKDEVVNQLSFYSRIFFLSNIVSHML